MSPYFKRLTNHIELFINFLRKKKCTKFPVRGRFRCRVGVGR